MGALITSAVIITSAAIILGKDKSPKRDQLGTASMTIDKQEVDLGNMKVSDEKSATFIVTNSGASTLRIWNVLTSCNCTFANITIAEQKTGEFNMAMHTNSTLKNWIGEVPAGQAATLEVIYRPKVMPVSGPVNRQVNFSTNDPNNATVEVTVKANVL